MAVDIRMAGKELELTVMDDGSGFTVSEQQAVKAYFHSNPQDDLEHSGLGMYISRVYCEKHGGRLAVGEEQQKKLESLMALFSALQARGMTGQVTEFIDLTTENVVRFGYGGTLTVEMPLFGNFESQTWRLQRALEELSARNGTVSGTLHLPSEGNKAWLLAKRCMPGDEMESSPTGEGENAVSPAPET